MDKDGFTFATIAESGDSLPMTPEAEAWLRDVRKISPQTASKLGVGAGFLNSFRIVGSSHAVFFKYPTGWKAKAFPEKDFTQLTGTKAEFWNLDRVLAGPMERVYIIEGEMDACALVEAGIAEHDVLSVPSGTTGLEYVEEALAKGLDKVKRFVWCGDADTVGIELRSKMASVLRVARFDFIEWPEGIKDANDLLRHDGAQALYDLVTFGALPWPSNGLFTASQLPTLPSLTPWSTGFPSWDGKIHLAPRTLSVVTGQPGHGKTSLFAQIFHNIADAYDLKVCIATFETAAKPHYIRALQQLHGRGLLHTFDQAKLAGIDRWIEEHYLWAQHPQRAPDLNWLLDQAEIACVRHGAKIVQLDPWNRLEAARQPKETETEYIGACLRKLYDFAGSYNCHFQILTHPAKSLDQRRGAPPELEDIASSKHWDNMVDQGFVVWRPRMFDDEGNRLYYAELHHKKARFEELGYPTKFGIEYDPDQGRFGVCPLNGKKRSTVEQPTAPEPPPRRDNVTSIADRMGAFGAALGNAQREGGDHE